MLNEFAQAIDRPTRRSPLQAWYPPFAPRFPWIGPDLQTLRNFLVRHRDDLRAFPGYRVALPMCDGSGDTLLGTLHTTSDTTRPLAMLLHGLTGSAESYYVLNTARHLLALGFPVLRLNWRSAGPSRASCAQEYHAGRSQDLRDALATLPEPWRSRSKVAIGYSLGGNILLKYLGEEGTASALAAAVSISAPFDLAAAGARFRAPRNFLYQRAILRSMKRDLRRGPGPVDGALLRAGLDAHTLREFDNGYIAPRYGFRDAEDYYARSSANAYVGGIRVPTLVIHAANDPWIPGTIYNAYDWSQSPSCRLLMPRGGGHVGFHGTGSTVPWTDRCIGHFFDVRC